MRDHAVAKTWLHVQQVLQLQQAKGVFWVVGFCTSSGARDPKTMLHADDKIVEA